MARPASAFIAGRTSNRKYRAGHRAIYRASDHSADGQAEYVKVDARADPAWEPRTMPTSQMTGLAESWVPMAKHRYQRNPRRSNAGWTLRPMWSDG